MALLNGSLCCTSVVGLTAICLAAKITSVLGAECNYENEIYLYPAPFQIFLFCRKKVY